MTAALYLLGCQALPALCKQHGLRYQLGSDIYVPNLTRAQMRTLESRRMEVISRLFRQFGTTWWDVFENSDIGKERLALASEFGSGRRRILDVGCGRGFFTFACSKRGGAVTSLDLMDGLGRAGWWSEFRETAELLTLEGRVSGVRGSAAALPFDAGSFDLASCVHAIRNFRSAAEVKALVREARRVLKKGGSLVIVESSMANAGASGYGRFYSLRTELGWEMELPPPIDIMKWARDSGFKKVSQSSRETGLKYAPVYFPYDQKRMRELGGPYADALDAIERDLEAHPPISITTAVR